MASSSSISLSPVIADDLEAPVPSRFRVAVKFAPALVLVRVVGDLTASHAHQVEDALDAARVRVRPDQLLVLDIRGVTRCDTQALGRLGAALGRGREDGVEIRICGGLGTLGES